jgi:hypothetical protein
MELNVNAHEGPSCLGLVVNEGQLQMQRSGMKRLRSGAGSDPNKTAIGRGSKAGETHTCGKTSR